MSTLSRINKLSSKVNVKMFKKVRCKKGMTKLQVTTIQLIAVIKSKKVSNLVLPRSWKRLQMVERLFWAQTTNFSRDSRVR